MINILLWLLKIILAFVFIILAFVFIILAVIFVVLCVKFTFIFDYRDEKPSFIIKIFGIKIDIIKIINKKPKKAKKAKKDAGIIKKQEKSPEKDEKKEDINKNDKDLKEDFDFFEEKEEKSEKFDFEKFKNDMLNFSNEKDKYLDSLADILDILEELAFSFKFKNIDINLQISTGDVCKTGQYIGYFWIIYGNLTAFLYNNFIIKKYHINAIPLFEEEKIIVDGNITITIRLISVLTHIKYKKIMQIKGRFF